MGTRAEIILKSPGCEERYQKIMDGYPAGVMNVLVSGIRELTPPGAQSVDLREISFSEVLRAEVAAGRLEPMAPSTRLGDVDFRYEIHVAAEMLEMRVYNRLPIGKLGEKPALAPLFRGTLQDFTIWARDHLGDRIERQN